MSRDIVVRCRGQHHGDLMTRTAEHGDPGHANLVRALHGQDAAVEATPGVTGGA